LQAAALGSLAHLLIIFSHEVTEHRFIQPLLGMEEPSDVLGRVTYDTRLLEEQHSLLGFLVKPRAGTNIVLLD